MPKKSSASKGTRAKKVAAPKKKAEPKVDSKEVVQTRLMWELVDAWVDVCKQIGCWTEVPRNSKLTLSNPLTELWEEKEKQEDETEWRMIYYMENGEKKKWERIKAHKDQQFYFASAMSLVRYN
jgi:hypothetical protein